MGGQCVIPNDAEVVTMSQTIDPDLYSELLFRLDRGIVTSIGADCLVVFLLWLTVASNVREISLSVSHASLNRFLLPRFS